MSSSASSPSARCRIPQCGKPYDISTGGYPGLCAECAGKAAETKEKKRLAKEEKERKEQKEKANDEDATHPSSSSSPSSSSPSSSSASSDESELKALVASFQDGPPEYRICPIQLAALQNEKKPADAATLVKAIKAAQDAVRKVPGADVNQLFFLFTQGFKRGSSVVLGGSRVRSYFTGTACHKETSDLDAGFGNLNVAQAKSIAAATQAKGPLAIEQGIGIVPGNKFPGQPDLRSPEEFFHRTGNRPASDPKSAEEPIAQPSGSLTYAPNGEIRENGPTVSRGSLDIPGSGAPSDLD